MGRILITKQEIPLFKNNFAHCVCIDKLLFTLGVKGLLCMRLGGVDTRCEKKMNEICDTTFGTFVTI